MSVTVAVTSIKIDITSTGSAKGTLAELYTAVQASSLPGLMTISGSDPYVYTVVPTAGSYVELEISSGCWLDCPNAGDTLKLGYDTSAAEYLVLDILDNGVFTMEAGGQTLDLGAQDTSKDRPRVTVGGRISVKGTSGNRTTIKNYARFYDYTESKDITIGTEDTVIQGMYFDYVDFEDAYYSSTIFLIGYSCAGYPTHEFTNLTITQPNSTITAGHYFTYGSYTIGYQKVKFENIVLDGMADGIFLTNSTSPVYLKNTIIKNTYQERPLIYGASHISNNGGITTNYSNFNEYMYPINQPHHYFENCSFINNRTETPLPGRWGIYNISYGAIVCLKDCTLGGTDSGSQITKAFQVQHDSIVYLIGTTTFQHLTGTAQWTNNNAQVLKGYEVAINIKDKNNNPIENATVIIEQSEGKEYWNFITDSNGDVKAAHDLDIILVNGKYTGTNLTGTFEDWSDSIASDRYHTITVIKEGVGIYSKDFILDSNKTFNIILNTYIETNSDFKHITHKIINGIS